MEDLITYVDKDEFVPSGKPTVEISPSFFCIITGDVMFDKSLSHAEKNLYALITSLCHVKGYCWLPNSEFETLMESSKATIKRWIANLKVKDYIFIEYIEDEETGAQLERRIYPVMNVEHLRQLAKNSKIGERKTVKK